VFRVRSALAAVAVVAIATASVAGLASCGSGSTARSDQADQSFLSAVHLADPNVAVYRTDVQLTRLGHAACDGFKSGVSFQQLADRLVLLEGNKPLPSADLGAVIDAAVTAYCPQFHNRVA
jgi:hypothetical protein